MGERKWDIDMVIAETKQRAPQLNERGEEENFKESDLHEEELGILRRGDKLARFLLREYANNRNQIAQTNVAA